MNSSAAKESLSEASRLHLVERDQHERRRNRRAPLNWLVYIKCESSTERLLTRTRDISSDGFYCLLNQPVRPGEHIECDIVVPTHGTRHPNDVVYLRCKARAVRVEEIDGGLEFGVACRIEEYRVLTNADSPTLLR